MNDAFNRPKGKSTRSLSGLWPFLKPYRIQIAFAIFFLICAAITTLAFPLALRMLVDGGLVSHNSTNVIQHQDIKTEQVLALRGHFLSLFGVAALLAVFSGARFYTVSWLGERITADVRSAVYSHVLQQSPEFFETTQTGEVLSRLSADTTLIQNVVGSTLSMGLRNMVMGLGALGVLIWTNPFMMLQVMVFLFFIFTPMMWFGRKVRTLSRDSQDRIANSSAIASEILNAISVVQSYTAEKIESERFGTNTNHAFATAIKRNKARSFLVAFIIMASSAGLLWGLYQGTQAVMNGTMTAGDLGQTVVYIVILASSLAILGEIYGDVLRAAGATERLIELLNTTSTVQSPVHPKAMASGENTGSAISFNQVEFSYPSRPLQLALSDFSLHIRAGETVALVGSSGAGKTTVLQMLLRFYDAQSGSITIDGVAVADLNLINLRQHIGIVPQDAVIFSTNAWENIRYGKPNATNEEVQQAAKAAFADEFLLNLPQGYDTFLGERGVRLSGGQRQRISIARAMLKNAPLLLLDEATSALDAESERMVQAALESAMQNRTTLVIAHRLATVQKADRIVVLDQGKIAEEGTHIQLVAQGGMYAKLAALQFHI